MSLPTIRQYLELIYTVAGILGVLGFWKFLWPTIARWWQRFTQPIRDLTAACQAMPQVQMQLGVIAREVLPNGGSSLRDVVTRTEVKVDRVEQRQLILEATTRARANNDPNLAMFECDTEGKNIEVSDTYCRWLNLSRDELLGWGFMSYVHPDDREKVREEWEACIADRRVYSMRHRLLTSGGEVLSVDVSCRPIPETGPVQRWIGVIRQVPV